MAATYPKKAFRSEKDPRRDEDDENIVQVGKIALGSSSAAYGGAGGLSGVEEKCYLHSTYIYIYVPAELFAARG